MGFPTIPHPYLFKCLARAFNSKKDAVEEGRKKSDGEEERGGRGEKGKRKQEEEEEGRGEKWRAREREREDAECHISL